MSTPPNFRFEGDPSKPGGFVLYQVGPEGEKKEVGMEALIQEIFPKEPKESLKEYKLRIATIQKQRSNLRDIFQKKTSSLGSVADYFKLMQQKPGVMKKIVAICWAEGCQKGPLQEDATMLKVCKACKKARYCSQECQKKDWARHKLDCMKTRSSKKK